MKRETMLSEKHTVATPRTSAAVIITSLARKINRCPAADCNTTNTNMFPIDSESFQLCDELLVPKLGLGEICHQRSFRSDIKGTGQPLTIHSSAPPQQVGVFGVDSNKRINLWNYSAASVTGALTSSKKSCLAEEEEEEENDDGDCDANTENGYECDDRRVVGMPFDDLFPSSSYVVSIGQTPPMPMPKSISLAHVLDKVLATGEPSMAVHVIAKAGRKRGRDEMTDANSNTCSFSVDFLPQFGSSQVPPPPTSDSNHNNNNNINNNECWLPTVSGVVLVCRSSEKKKQITKPSPFNIARSITIAAPSVDKIRSLSTSISGTCRTETETETEVGNFAKEIDASVEVAKIDNSFHSCQIDHSFRTNYQIDNSFRNCQIDHSIKNIQIIETNKRLAALEAFEGSNDSEGADSDEIDFPNLSLPPLTKRDSITGTRTRTTADTDEDYRTLFETIDTIIFGVDLSGNINEWNHKMEELTGISNDAAIGRSLLEDTSLPLLPFPDPSRRTPRSEIITLSDEVEPVLSDAYRGRSTSELNLKLKSTSSNTMTSSGEQKQHNRRGMLRHLTASVFPRYDTRQQVVGALFLGTDLTKGFTRFKGIQTDAHELRNLIDTANAPIFGIDAHGYVNEWNDKTAEITGYGKDDAFDCLLVDTFVLPDTQDSVRAVLQNALQHGKGTSNYELEFKTKSNEIRHLLVNITPQHDMDNVAVGVFFIAQDVTEAVERDRAVASMALELRQLIDTANAPIFGIDVHGKVNEWNTRMSTTTGFTREEALHIPLVENFIAPSMKERVGKILEAALNGNETSNYEVEVTSKSGEPIFLLVNATTRRDPKKNVIGVVGVAQDVTEDRKHTKCLRELEILNASQEAKVETERNMTAYFAHELANPLGAIDSALAAMPDKLPDNAQSLVSGMRLCTKFMSSIMNNLLDARKMEEGKMQLGVAPVSIRKILHNVHKMLTPSVRPGVEFRNLINVEGNDWVLGDAHRIEQVLTNVISNAIKYTVSGHIQISVEWENDHVKFICEDTGPGIPKSEQDKHFQRFVTTAGAPGTGLGLAIAKHIVDLAGGSIRCESDPSIKAGTTFVVLMALPLCKAPECSVEKKTGFIEEPLSVLIIDDIKMNRTMMKRRILKGIAPNAKIQEAATGEEALLICWKERFDVMIVDQFMEGAGGVMVGTDVVFAMRRMRIDSVLIGCSGNDIGTQFFEAGADMVWRKPMPSNDQIIRDLRSSLDKRSIALSGT